MIRLRPSGADEVLIKRVRDWYEPGPGVFIAPQALFNPALLFTTGVNGTWYDPSDLTTLFQDAAGTTPVTAVEQPVGLMLDKSKGLVLGAEQFPNYDFTNWGAAGGLSSRTATSFTTTSGGGVTKAIPSGSGKTYQIRIAGTTSATLTVRNSSTIDGATTINAGTFDVIITSPACFAATTTLYLALTGAATATISTLSVRELPGNHAFNPSGNSANFPVLSARYNGLLTTENLTGASWVLGGAASRTATTFTATSSSDFLFQTAGAFLGSMAPGIGLTASVELSGTGTIKFAILNGSGGDIGAQQINLTSTPTRYSISTSNTSTGVNIGVIFRGTGALVSANLSKVDFRVSNDSLNQPAYQRVNTTTDYDTVGFKPYLRFNGTNQWLQTNSIDFTYGDKMFVCAGVRKLSDAARGMVAELGADPGVSTFQLNAPLTVGDGSYSFGSAGSALSTINRIGFASPISSVVSGIGNIFGDLSTIRINGDVGTSNTVDQGTGNYGNYPFYIGARAGTSLWFNGRLHQLIVAGKQASDSEISQTEAFTNQKTGAY